MSSRYEQLWQICHESGFLRWQLQFALEAVEAETASIMLLDEVGENLVFCASVGANADKYVGGGDYEKAIRVPMSATRGINPLAVLYGKPMCMEESDPRHNPDIDKAVGTKTQSLYVIPLAVVDRAIGTFSAINAHQQREYEEGLKEFGQRDIEAMNAAARAVEFWIARRWEDLKL